MSWRRVKVLVKGLPPEASVFRAIPDMGGWTVTDHLLASAVDLLGIVSYHALVGPHADPKKLRSLKPPQQFPRPGQDGQPRRRQKRKATSADLQRMFGGSTAYRPREG